MVHEVFSVLGLTDYTIQLNHRQLLAGISETIGASGRQTELAVSLDKLNKMGPEKVLNELESKGFSNHQLTKLEPVLQWQGTWELQD